MANCTIEAFERRLLLDGDSAELPLDPADYLVGNDYVMLGRTEELGPQVTVGDLHGLASLYRARTSSPDSEYARLFAELFVKLTNLQKEFRNTYYFMIMRQESFGFLEGGKLMIHIGVRSTESVMRVAISRTGRIRVFESEMECFSGLAKNVKRVELLDRSTASKATLDETIPSAVIHLNGGNDLLIANNNANTIYGGSGDDTIYAGGGDDVVYGDEGTDRLFGEGGNDTLFGGAHKDFLNGGSGRNILVGGSGTDYFTVRTKDKTDREPRDHVTVIS